MSKYDLVKKALNEYPEKIKVMQDDFNHQKLSKLRLMNKNQQLTYDVEKLRLTVKILELQIENFNRKAKITRIPELNTKNDLFHNVYTYNET